MIDHQIIAGQLFFNVLLYQQDQNAENDFLTIVILPP